MQSYYPKKKLLRFRVNQRLWMVLFSWMGKYKKILNSMHQNHQNFVLHRLVVARNRYTEYCHGMKKQPLLPAIKS